MMNALKNPSFIRPASRPSSPAPTPPSRTDHGLGGERMSPLHKLSLGSFRRASPASVHSTPNSPNPLVQDGSYLEILSLKLSEAVSKALAQPTGPAGANDLVAGRRPIPAGRGHALGALIASELKATHGNPHLYRAILRSLHRPLSVLLTNLSAQLLPLLSMPAFHPPQPPSAQNPNLNPIYLHALSISTFTGELLETFDELGLGLDGDIRGDGLKFIREGLVSVVGRVVYPLVGAMKNELVPLIEGLEFPNKNNDTKTVAGGKIPVSQDASIAALQNTMPIYARALSRYISTPTSQTMLATFLLSVIWRALVALSHRPDVLPLTAAGDKSSVMVTKRRGSPSSIFPSHLPSGPPSPSSVQVPSTTAGDSRVLYDLLNLFPRPIEHNETTRLAKEAVDEAFDGLKALPVLLEYPRTVPGCAVLAVGQGSERGLEVLTKKLPTLIALPVVLRVYIPGAATVAEMLGLPEDEYRNVCLAGFGRSDECATAVVQRVLDVLRADCQSPATVLRWLEIEISEADC